MISRTAFNKKPSFFFYMAIVGILAVLIGFARTFIFPLAVGSFRAPAIIHIHGAFAFSWICLFMLQVLLIHMRNYKTHARLGILGLIIATGVSVTMIPAGLFAVQRDLQQGLGESAYSTIIGVLTSGAIFLALVIAGMLTRRKPQTHKRLMLLATIVVLWPAWFRFRHYFPSVPRPDIWFALVLSDSLIVVAWIRDKIKTGRIHPVLGWVGLCIIVEQTAEVICFDHPVWRTAAESLYWFFV
jgi:hypothetical protein